MQRFESADITGGNFNLSELVLNFREAEIRN